MAERLRGRAAVEQRERRLRQHPLCAHCAKVDKITVTAEIDHITPLAFGGTDTDDNVQGLCLPCHAAKTATEGANKQAAANHPDWIRPSAIPTTIVAGPPCSGKTTYVSKHSRPGDTVIDLDSIMMKLQPGYRHWSDGLHQSLLNSAIRARNAMLGNLCRETKGQAWFIVSAPSEAERRWWQTKLGGEVLLLHPGVDECKRRAAARGTPRAVAGVDAWEKSALAPWRPPASRAVRAAVGLDGWPVDAS
ncbi:HNH endonuclease [Sphingobium phenoxybenzoativorans]|uniref:HNH endonuclease n=1 Tax=Sphingobium phenoxybenzoativorans TaxID=1592790 RepID=A0A975Q3Y0_9SPHN|nr:HNH endonuclease [Sphingobium phenoxybenzoativorans]